MGDDARMNPSFALGLLWHEEEEAKPQFVSACFMFR